MPPSLIPSRSERPYRGSGLVLMPRRQSSSAQQLQHGWHTERRSPRFRDELLWAGSQIFFFSLFFRF